MTKPVPLADLFPSRTATVAASRLSLLINRSILENTKERSAVSDDVIIVAESHVGERRLMKTEGSFPTNKAPPPIIESYAPLLAVLKSLIFHSNQVCPSSRIDVSTVPDWDISPQVSMAHYYYSCRS